MSIENGSAGVMIAATTRMATEACLRYFFSVSRVTIPILERIAMSTGNSNTIPNRITIEENIEIYEFKVIVFAMLSLTEYP